MTSCSTTPDGAVNGLVGRTGTVPTNRRQDRRHHGVAGPSGDQGTADATGLKRQYEPSAASTGWTPGARRLSTMSWWAH